MACAIPRNNKPSKAHIGGILNNLLHLWLIICIIFIFITIFYPEVVTLC